MNSSSITSDMTGTVARTGCRSEAERFGLPFFMLLFYLVAEYARPALLGPVRPALLSQIVLVMFLIGNRAKAAAAFKERYSRLYLFLLGIMAIHLFCAVNNYWAFMQFRVMLSYLVVGVSCCVFLDSLPKIRSFLFFFIFVMSLCAVNRLCGAGVIGVTGVMGDTNDFALAMNVVLPLSLFMGRAEEGMRRYLLGAASLLFVAANVVCASRGGLMGLLAVGAVYWLSLERKGSAAVICCLVAGLAWSFAAPEFRNEILSISDSAENDTGKERIELWKAGWRAFLDNPVLGVGQGNMPLVMGRYQYDERGNSFWGRELYGKQIHSFYFTLLPELGLAGAIVFLLMLKDLGRRFRRITILLRTARKREPAMNHVEAVSRGLLTAVVAFLVSGTFISVFYYPEFWNVSFLLVALWGCSSLSAWRLGGEPATATGSD